MLKKAIVSLDRVAKRFLEIFSKVFKISSRLLKEPIFGSIFSLWLKTMLNTNKTLKRYYIATLNVKYVKSKSLILSKSLFIHFFYLSTE